MTNSLLVTKYIRYILSQDEALMSELPLDKIFAIDAKQGTKFPFAVIARTGMFDNLSKDGIYEDVVYVTVIVVDDNYIGSIKIANEIRNWLEGHIYKNDEINITRIRLSSSSESLYNDAYIQTLEFNIYIH